jgi:predicted nucleotidyltransferase
VAAIRDAIETVEAARNPALLRLVAAIRRAYGPRLERIVLFGSRARGDADPDSDYDIAVFLHDLDDRLAEIGRLWSIEQSIVRPEDPIFELIPLRAGCWRDRTTFMFGLREEGREL